MGKQEIKPKPDIYCRWSPSLGELEEPHWRVWGTKEYDPALHNEKPCIFFGMYSARDYEVLFKHGGKKWILWAGSDIRNFVTGLAFGDGSLIELSKRFQGVCWILSRWINENCENWCENEVERKALASLGIASKVCPSFLGDIKKYPKRFRAPKKGEKTKVYLSSGKDRQEEYGFGVVERIAGECPNAEFHLYGAEWETKHKNVIVHGRVPKTVMNVEISKMHIGLRLNEFDGFSEITAKSILWGQHPIVRREFKYPYLDSFETEKELIGHIQNLPKKGCNVKYREAYRDMVNSYPWNLKKS